ncbi:MFS transporter, partial [Pleomassaria siparia CBS 279.74]
EYLPTGKLVLVMFSLYITMFLIALDKTILATAIPRITDAFGSLSDIGWYGSSYMLTLCAFQLFWGRIYTLHSVKPVFLAAIIVFEIGSAVCGAAPSSTAFILGRSIAGLGSAGVMNGAIIVTVKTVPLAKRPLIQGLFGAVFGIASVVGPLLRGVFTESVSWSFYINLPCGALTIAILVFVLKLPKRMEKKSVPLGQQSRKLDPMGTVVFLPAVVCLLLALQWGGSTYAWSNWRIILLFTLFSVLLITFIAIQILTPDTATIPMRILTQRTVAASFLFTFTTQAVMLCITYNASLFFQALKNFSPISSGLATLPAILGLVIGSIFAGGMVQRLGYPAPFMIASAILSSVGAGLITTWKINVGAGMWIGYQVF